MSIEVHSFSAVDLPVALRIVCAAYDIPASQTELYCEKLEMHTQLQSDGWFLAILDGVPVGFGGMIDYTHFARLGMMSVLPYVQRLGVGRALMTQLLAWGGARACPTIVLDATPVGVPLYRQFGFIDDGVVVQWNRLAAQLPVLYNPSSVLCVTAMRAADLPALVDFDARAFGAARPRMFDLFLTSYPARAFVVRDSADQLQGYLFIQEYTLGPWVAVSEQAAEQLLSYVLEQVLYNTYCNVISPAANSSAAALLERHGFRAANSLRSMRRGQPLVRSVTRLYSLASYAIG